MQKDVSLKPFNTFGIDVKTDWLAKIESIEQLLTIIDDLPEMKKLILGQGSNVLFLNDFNGIVLLNEIKGKEIIDENENEIRIKINGGENWHQLVMWAVENNYGGIENLALIPGKVGTAPMQNIGAYGVEIKDVLEEVHTINMKTCEPKIFTNKDCNFGYRHSVFKLPENKGKYFISAVVLKLSKKNHQLKTDYGAIQKVLQEKNIQSPTIKDIAEAVMKIRRSKLPDPNLIGNAGSFFKNPIVDKIVFDKLISEHPKMPYYQIDDKYKIPAGWLIEQAGFKGKRFGDVGVHKNQALVIVNYGKATGMEIKNLADIIMNEVEKKFYIKLQPEVNYIE